MNAMFMDACEYDMKSSHLMNKTLLPSLHIYTDKKFSDTANTINIRCEAGTWFTPPVRDVWRVDSFNPYLLLNPKSVLCNWKLLQLKMVAQNAEPRLMPYRVFIKFTNLYLIMDKTTWKPIHSKFFKFTKVISKCNLRP